MPQTELVKFYSFFIDETRSLPIVKDYHSISLNYEQCLSQKHLRIPYLYAFCHKNMLPLDYAILEEENRARKWIGDLLRKNPTQSTSQLQNAGGKNNSN